METFLFNHEAEIRLYLFLGAFGSFAFWESFQPRRRLVASTGARWFNNFALLILGIVAAAWLLPALAVGSALMAEKHGWGVLHSVALPHWAAFLITFVLIDLVRYAQHRVLHRFGLLWRLHQVHHADLDMDCTTSFRFHPIETLLTLTSYFALLIALGAMPIAVLAAETAFIVSSMFTHANSALPAGLERRLRLVFVTPEMHRVHHSAHPLDRDRNFSGIFSWWDRLFGTYQAAPHAGHERIVFGLGEPREREAPFTTLLWTPFKKRS